MNSLKINDIKEWLVENRDEYQKLKAQEFPPFDNSFYSTYNCLHDFIGYYQFKSQCETALCELTHLNNTDFGKLVKWTKSYEKLGSQDLLMFETNYIDWKEQVGNDKIKIHEGLYAERKPFEYIICFCKVFQNLYWDNCIHEAELTESEKSKVVAELKAILKTY